MRTMADAIEASQLPTGCDLYAGYVNGQWPSYGPIKARFPEKIVVSITINASTPAIVLDVETGDATPTQAPGWVHVMRAAGVTPTIYCSLALWTTVRRLFERVNEPEPNWWIAAYPGCGASLYATSVAHQYQNANGYDLSVVADYWPGVDPVITDPSLPKGVIVMGVAVAQTGRLVVDGVTTDGHKHVLLGPEAAPGTGGPKAVSQGKWTDMDLSAELEAEEGHPVLFTS